MAGEEAVDEADVVRDVEAEAEADEARAHNQSTIEPAETRTGVREWQSERGGDEHHAGDRAHTKNQKIKDTPTRLADGAEYEKGDGGRAGESMHDTDEQGAERMK